MTPKALAMRSPVNDNQSVSVSVRKIENGYVTSRSLTDSGSYEHKEVFSKDRPDLTVGQDTMRSDNGPDSGMMKAAVAKLNSRR